MINLLRKRRSVRNFKAANIESEKIKILEEAALRSPTSRNIMPWEFIFVTDKGKLEKLSNAKQHGSAFVAGAPLAIVICADTTKSDVWVEDCSIAAIVLQMSALSIGLGSCWVQIRNRKHSDETTSEDFVKHLLKIPDDYSVECIIAAGYPDEEKEEIPYSALASGKIHKEDF